MNERYFLVLDLISNFLWEIDENILVPPINRLMMDLETKNPYCFKRGKPELWAAALTYAVAKENSMQYLDTENPITKGRIADFFGVKKNSLGTKMSKIFNEMGMSQFSRKYGIGMDIFYDDVEEEEEEHLHTLIALIEVSNPREEMDNVWKNFVDEFNEDELDYYEIIGEEYEENILTLTFEVADFFAMEFVNRLDFIGKVIEVLQDPSNENEFIPVSHYETFMKYHTSMNLDNRSFEDIEELNEYMHQFANIPIDELPNHIPQNPIEQAEIQAIDAYHLPKEDSLQNIERILKDYPNTVEAYICKAGWEEDPETQLDLLYQALDAGENKLDIEDINKEKMWWGFHITRPYMRALNILAIQLFRMGYIEEAVETIDDLLKKNPNDNQGVRYFAIQVFAEKGKWVKLKNLFRLFADEDSVEFDLGKLLYYFYKGKNKARAKRTLEILLDKSPGLQAMCAGESDTEFQEDEFIFAIVDHFMSKDKKFGKWFSITLMDLYEKKEGFSEDREARVIPLNQRNMN